MLTLRRLVPRQGIVIQLLALSLVALSCSKLNIGSNCLNETSGCFRPDKTAPQFQQSVPTSGANGTYVSTLSEIQLMFSEELKDPRPSDFTFTGGDTGMTITSVEQIDKYTYRLHTNRNPVVGGDLTLSFPNLKDYNGNKISNGSAVFKINLSIPITLDSVSRYAISGIALVPPAVPGIPDTVASPPGYQTIAVRWHFDYNPVIAGASSYNLRISSAVDCSTGTLLNPVATPAPNPAVNSTVATYDATNATTINNTTYTFTLNKSDIPSGKTYVLICITNATNNKTGVQFLEVTRDDAAPTVAITPVSGNFAAPQTVTVSCSDNFDRIAYASDIRTDGSFPAAGSITDPAFDPASGVLTSGTAVATNPFVMQTPYSNDPTRSIFKYRCIDTAGNPSAVLTSGTFDVNSSNPVINVVSLTKTSYTPVTAISGIGTGGHTSVTLTWNTNQINALYEIRANGTACGAGGTQLIQGPAGVGTGTPSPAFTNSTFAITPAILGGVQQVHTIMVCVHNGTTWGQTNIPLILENNQPTTLVNVPAGNYGSQQNIVISCNNYPDKIAYDITTAPLGSVPATPVNPTFDAAGNITAGTLFSGPILAAAQTVTSLKWKCFNKAGRESVVGSASYTIDTVLPTVTVASVQRTAVSNLGGAYPTTQILWNTDRPGLTYEVRNSGNCNGGPGGGGAAGAPGSATRYTGTTPAVGNNVVTNLSIAAGDFGTIGFTYPYKICVFNAINNAGFQTTPLDITRDETVPVFPGPASINAVDTTNFTLIFTAATDANLAGYRVYRSTSSGSYLNYPASPDYVVASIPPTLTMPDTQPYFLRIVAYDIAGNTTIIGSGEIATKPIITVVVSGSSGSFNLSDGTSTNTVTGNSTFTWNTALGISQTYNFAFSSQPPGQICAIREKQFGTLVANITITVDCTNGQMVAGRFQQVKASNVSYMLYRASSTALASSQTNPTSLIYAAGYIFYGNYADCDGGTPGNQYCLFKVPATSGSVATHVTGVTAPIRGVTTDGTNIYYSVESPNNGVYKVPIAGGTPTLLTNTITAPYGIALDGNYLYVCSGGALTIRRLDLTSGAIADIAGPLTNYPLGIEVVGTDLYFTTWGTHAIYKVPKSGGSPTVVFGNSGTSGMQDGNGTGALLNQPHDLVYDGVDNLYFAEYGGNRLKKARLSTGRVITLLGDGSAAFSLGSGASAKVQNPVGITSDGKRLFLSNHNAGSSVTRIADQNNVGHWPLNAQPSDFSSDGFNGSFDMTPTGSPTVVLGRYGEANGAYRFDGSSTWFSTPHQNQFNLTSAYTISTWINTNSTSNQRIVDKATAGAANGYVLDIVSNRYRLIHGVSASTELVSNKIVTTGAWVHVLATYSQLEKRARIFINGHLDAEQLFGTSASTPTNTLPLRIGSDSNGANVFSGAMAGVRIYGRVLNDSEINELAQDASPAQVGSSFNTGPTEALVIYQFTGGTSGTANLTGSGASGGGLTPNCSSPLGKDGDASGSCYLDGNNNLAPASGGSAGTPWGSAPRTLCIWYNPPVFPNNDVLIAHGRGTAPLLQGFGISVANAGQIQFFNWGGPNVVFNYQTQLNTWQHVCGTLSGNSVEMFVNGVSIGSNTGGIGAVNTVNDATSALTFGSAPDSNPALRLNGSIDDARIYNKVLTAAEIRQLATQVPVGLVARYDFSGDTKDVSGQGIDLTNSGAAASADRFGVSNSAYHFNGINNMMSNASTTLPFPTGNLDRTMCFWGRADQANAGVRIGVAYGNSSANQASQIGFNNMETTNPTTLGCAFGAPCSPTGYIHQNTWHHVCMVVSGTSAQLYLNGSIIDTNGASAGTTVSAAAWNTQAGPIEVGSFSGNYRFPGDLDDIRIYNRALSQVEIQTLVQQPNKRIYVTARTYYGTLNGNGGVSGAPTGVTGVAGADAKCNWTGDANKPVAGTYKAMLGGGINNLRAPCASAYCATNGIAEGIDWVLRPKITYIRDVTNLPIFTANSSGIFDFGTAANNPSGSTTFANAISATVASPWTGVNRYWNNDTACGSWDDVGTFDGKAVFGYATGTDQGNAGTNGVIYQNWTQTSVGMQVSCTAYALPLYCVEQ